MQVDNNESDENEQIYLVRTGYLYEYNELNFLTYLNDYCVPICKEDFNEILSESLEQSQNNFEQTEYAGLLPVLYLRKVYSKQLVEKYSQLVEQNIVISNTTSNLENMYVRVRAKTLGSEDFFLIKNKESKIWRRTPGKYLAEVLSDKFESTRYYIESGNEYELTKERTLFNLTKRCLAEKVGSKELFNHITHIKLLDVKLGGFIYYDIIYENCIKFKLNNKEYPAPYYKNIDPQYTRGKKFSDKCFAANDNQINAIDNETGLYVKPHFLHLPASVMKLGQIKYLRPSELFKGKPYHLFKDQIECSDVKQGRLGNCYLISIIAALSERHDLIKKIFKSATVNEDGFYEIYYYEQDGSRRIMFIDDLFPITDNDNDGSSEYLGTIPNQEEIWVMLLEKAYAKYEGGWVNLDGGTITSELKFFLGSNCKDLNLKTSTAWEEILSACRRDNIVCCRSKKGSGTHDFKSTGNIANSHAYSILEAEEKKGIRLLRIRNPWGSCEWNGDFSDNSPLWTDEMKKEFDGFYRENKDDGVFCIKYEDFCNEFSNVVVCYC